MTSYKNTPLQFSEPHNYARLLVMYNAWSEWQCMSHRLRLLAPILLHTSVGVSSSPSSHFFPDGNATYSGM